MQEAIGRTNDSPNAQAASAQQQAQFDLLLGRARQLMGEAGEQWLATLEAAPVDGAVTLGTQTLRQLVQMSEQAGQPVDPVVLIHVGLQFCKDIAGIANAAGIVPDEQIESFLRDAMQQSMAEYLRMDAEDGLLSEEDKARAAQILGQGGGGQPSAEQPTGMLARMQQGGA
jgi:hypothetical protein